MPTLHLLGLPHTQLTRAASVCAFTQKAVKFVPMMQALGWTVVSYWGDGNEAGADEHVPLFTRAEQERWYGTFDPNRLPGLATFDSRKEDWQIFNGRALTALKERVGDRDIVLSLAGYAHQPVTREFPMVAEWAAGYQGWCEKYVCFESHAWMHHQYGTRQIHDGRFYDVVIPNFFDPNEWTLPVQQGGDHVAFVGRMIARKGPQIAADVAREAGVPIVFAGSGVVEWTPEKIVCEGGFEIVGERMEYVGTVGGVERNRIMRDARAVFATTAYIEPFGAVAVEAQLCGTPAITTDFGAFPETVIDGQTGYRMRTLLDGILAVEDAQRLNPEAIRSSALNRYSLSAVGPMYDRWFRSLLDLWKDGWYTGRRITGGEQHDEETATMEAA